ncbi:MAG: hypothetical protein K5798_10520 [Nitrosopumilus sp.]|uniref:hypothetical protein n=1 Tax=Nitrosopumilus sp. TaxID=2024843 RepID=UPI0024308508|nr:hypothetical protein [Nitrosopumilus sp.]MCV0367679.1 hypothetical protein [Nitrosopumilus sp.]
MKFFTILLIFFFVISFVFVHQKSFADCRIDNDWSNKPCLDMPPYPKSELLQIWGEYYSIKGMEWMENKKSEMDYAIQKGIFEEWLAYGTKSGNFQNHNVYVYYFLHGDAPTIGSYYEILIKKENTTQYVETYSNSTKDIYELIITYYYISFGVLLVLISMTAGFGTVGFVVWRKRK